MKASATATTRRRRSHRGLAAAILHARLRSYNQRFGGRRQTEDRSGPSVIARCRELGWRLRLPPFAPTTAPAIEAFSQERPPIPTSADLNPDHRRHGPRPARRYAGGDCCGYRAHDPWIFRADARRGSAENSARDSFARRRGNSRASDHHQSARAARSGAVESLDAIADLLPHAVSVIHGARHDS